MHHKFCASFIALFLIFSLISTEVKVIQSAQVQVNKRKRSTFESGTNSSSSSQADSHPLSALDYGRMIKKNGLCSGIEDTNQTHILPADKIESNFLEILGDINIGDGTTSLSVENENYYDTDSILDILLNLLGTDTRADDGSGDSVTKNTDDIITIDSTTSTSSNIGKENVERYFSVFDDCENYVDIDLIQDILTFDRAYDESGLSVGNDDFTSNYGDSVKSNDTQNNANFQLNETESTSKSFNPIEVADRKETEKPSKKICSSSSNARLIKKQLAKDLKDLFVKQTGDDIKNYYNYDIENFPADSRKQFYKLTLTEVRSIRSVFDTLKFYKSSRTKNFDFKMACFNEQKREKIKKGEAQKILLKRYRDESGDSEALHINWNLVDLSQIPEKFSPVLEVLRSSRIYSFASIFQTIAILDNIHFFPEDKNVIARKKANPLIEAHRILLEQYRKDMNLPDACNICWDIVESVSGLDGINYFNLKKSAALKIINAKDNIRFLPQYSMI